MNTMKRKLVFIILCLVWLAGVFYYIFPIYPVPDEISVETQPPHGSIIEFPNHYIYKAYKGNGKYFISYENLRSEDIDPIIYEITKTEYYHCAAISPRRFECSKVGSAQYDIVVRYGNDVRQYCFESFFSPLHELETLYASKADEGEGKNAQDNLIDALTDFFDSCSIDAEFVIYPTDDNPDYYLYGNVTCQDFNDDVYDLKKRHYSNRTLDIALMKKYEAGIISEPNLKADFEKKKEIYEQATGGEFLETLSGYEKLSFLLNENDRVIKQSSKRYILQNETTFLSGYTHKAYGDITYGDKGVVYYEIYLPDEGSFYTVGLIKPALMPKWYLRTALDNILLNDGNTIVWGMLYVVPCFFILAVTGCLLLWVIIFGRNIFKNMRLKKQEHREGFA